MIVALKDRNQSQLPPWLLDMSLSMMAPFADRPSFLFNCCETESLWTSQAGFKLNILLFSLQVLWLPMSAYTWWCKFLFLTTGNQRNNWLFPFPGEEFSLWGLGDGMSKQEIKTNKQQTKKAERNAVIRKRPPCSGWVSISSCWLLRRERDLYAPERMVPEE